MRPNDHVMTVILTRRVKISSKTAGIHPLSPAFIKSAFGFASDLNVTHKSENLLINLFHYHIVFPACSLVFIQHKLLFRSGLRTFDCQRSLSPATLKLKPLELQS